MIYLESFDFFGNSEPVLFFDRNLPRSTTNRADMYNHYTQNREEWTPKEIDTLESLVETSNKVEGFGFNPVYDNPNMLIFYFVLWAEEDGDLGVEIYCHKCYDEVYLLQEYRLDEKDKRYYCDGFDCLIKLMNTYL
jgi:hypothetical protein